MKSYTEGIKKNVSLKKKKKIKVIKARVYTLAFYIFKEESYEKKKI